MRAKRVMCPASDDHMVQKAYVEELAPLGYTLGEGTILCTGLGTP